MIKDFVRAFDANRSKLREGMAAERPKDYDDIVKRVVGILADEDRGPDPDRITAIDHGDYQGTRVFIIAASGYQPSDYWYVKIGYGSCSGCDTFEAIEGYGGDPLTDAQLDQYMTLALHVVQGLKAMGEESV